MRFYSKKGKVLFPVLIMVLILMAGSSLTSYLDWDFVKHIPGIDESDRVSLFVTVPVMVLILWLIAGTYYEINGEVLKVAAGPIRYTIHIHTISAIKASNNPLSSPALSLDRLKITYNHGNTVLISPKDKQEFINEILKVNPNIKVNLKKK
ncbi:PH domain-containing protein [Bacillus sp. Marseille-Q1617]|uniref:PH domain-containing protein n=1 Tax=Bacillus sp. Marseille-Q1617 TaxID=2736887 RepID=UPI00158CB640|nr:PH domain-containing protein [Bacillus sp. Marseille-Q1617]